MPRFAGSDGTDLFFCSHGDGPPVVLLSSWAFSSQMWERQVDALTAAGLRVIAPDRRGHGRSDWPSGGYVLDVTADDAHALLEHLDLRDVTLVGHSVGGGEAVRLLARHGSDRVRGIALVSAVAPWVAGTPGGPTPEAAMADLDALRRTRGRWFARQTQLWFATHLGNEVDDATIDWMIAMGMASDPYGLIRLLTDAVAADHSADLRALDLPALVVHGGADHVVPVERTGRLTADLLPRATLLEVPDAGHGLFHTHADELSAALVELARSAA